MYTFANIVTELRESILLWELNLVKLDHTLISTKRNTQNRNIKQIVGHMVDSASNNTHRIIHLQYQASPLIFPDYANLGNNDKWIAIQNYETEKWTDLVLLWKYTNLHFCHVVEHVNSAKLKNIWLTATNEKVTLEEMITDYPRHFNLHLSEIEQLINQ